jgi:hypothetical protein
MKYLVLLLSMTATISCFQHKNKDDVMLIWESSQAICVYWTQFAEDNLETQALSFELTYRDSIDWTKNKLVFYDTYLTADTLSVNFRKNPVKKGNIYKLWVFVHPDLLKPYLRRKMSNFQDDCFLLELANIIGNGKLMLIKSGYVTQVDKSPNYSFFIGTKK